MPLTFSVAEYADMIYVYGFCDSNSVHAVAEYQWLFWTVEYKPKECLLEFTRCCEIPVHFPAFALQPSMMLMEASMKKKALFRWYRAGHVRVRRELQDVFMFLTWECGKQCMQRACIHTTCSECNILDLAILLKGWNFASGSMAVASCIVTSFLLTKRNSIATVSIIHTTLTCGQMRIPTPLWKATFNYVLVSMCGVQFWTISWLVLSFWKVILQERRTSDFCRRNCPDLWRMCLWINEVVCIFNMTELLIFHVKLEDSCTVVSLGHGSAVAVPTIGQPGLQNKPTGLLCMRMDERTGLQCEGGNARCIAWSHFGCRRPHQKKSAEAATSNSPSSQPSGSLCCGRRWHFRKPALSTDKFKLKVISRS